MYKILIFISIFFFACTSYHSEQNQAAKTSQPSALSPETKAKAEKLIVAYLSLKDVLVKTDATAAKNAALALSDVTKAATQDSSISRQATDIHKFAVILSETDDIEKQRIAFSSISNATYDLAKATEVMQGKLYKQFCPMAFEDKGGFWLSGEKQVMNPYFGDKMLHCGKVMEEL